ncbi:MAG TPA: hypothetical protein VIU45_02590 [Chitinophagaceae bacterium]
MLKINNPLIAARGIPNPPPISCMSPSIPADNATFIGNLIVAGGALPANPPFEIHPYLGLAPLKNFEKYIIGTFPPISYVNDHPAIVAAGINIGGFRPPWIPFFHGNWGSMWNYLLTGPEYAALTAMPRIGRKPFLINFLTENRINCSDIIKTVQRRCYSPNDSDLFNICINEDLICHILLNKSAKYLLFNTGSPLSSGGLKIHGILNPNGAPGMVNVNVNTKSFDLFVRGCQEMGLTIELRINLGAPATMFPWTPLAIAIPNMHNKVIFEMRISTNRMEEKCKGFSGSREFTVITGPSPSQQATRGIVRNANFIQFQAANPGKNVSDFIRHIYQGFRFGPIINLYALNA